MKKGIYFGLLIWVQFFVWTSFTQVHASVAPADTVEELFSTVKQIKKADPDKNLILTSQDERQNDELSRKVNSLLDIEGISAYALQDYWNRRSTGDRKAFVNLFTTLLEKVAYPNTSDFLGDIDISIRNEKVIGQKAMVYTSVIHKKEGRIDIDFKLHRSGSMWVVEDVLLDGVSLARNLRTQSLKIIRDHSFEELLRRMRNKIENEDSEDFEEVTKRD